MIAALLFFAASTTAEPPRERVCQAMAEVTRVVAEAKRRGVTAEQAQAAADALDGDTGARAIARTVLWYVYVVNADDRLPPAQLSRHIRNACMASEPNALTGVNGNGR